MKKTSPAWDPHETIPMLHGCQAQWKGRSPLVPRAAKRARQGKLNSEQQRREMKEAALKARCDWQRLVVHG